MKVYLLVTAVLLLALDIRGSAVRVHRKGTSHSSKGNEFYLGFMQNQVTSRRSPTIPLFITTDEPQSVNFTVTAVHPNIVLFANASYGNVTTVHLPTEVVVTTERTTPGQEKMKGIHVKAENGKTISIVGSNAEQATTDSFIVLPVVDNPLKVRERYTILSNDFVRLSQNQALIYSEFLLVGSRSNTKVRITPNNTSIAIPSIYSPDRRYVAAGQKVEFTLNRMETLLITSANDLSGTVISSDEPISVFTGHECGQVPANVGTCDHLVEQVPPQHTWGLQFFTAPLKQESGDLFKMATTNVNLTEVNMTCTEMGKNYSSSTFRALSLGKNEVFSFEQGPYTYCCIESTNPLLVMQLGKGSSLNNGFGDPLLVTIPAVQQYTNNFTVVQDRLSSRHYSNIIVPAQYFEDTPQGHSRIRINNVTASKSWAPIFCNTGQICAYGAQTPLSNQVSTVFHEDPEAGMSVIVYGFGIDVAYGYSAGYNLDPIAFPIVSLEPGEHRVRGTSGNVTLVITRRGNIQTPVALHLTSDFIDPVGEVHLLSGELRREVTITVRTRLLPMATEIVTVLLSHSGNEDIILVHTEANITVLDDIEVGFENSSYIFDEDIVRVTLTIVASIPNPEPDPINFRIRTLGGTAQYEDDYQNVDSIIALAPMEQVLKYEIVILDDQRVEKLEVFSVILEIAPGQDKISGLTLGQPTTDIFIKDNDCVTIFLEPTNLTLYENESDAVIKVHKLGLSDLTTSVLVSTKDLSTTAHLDYEPLAGTTVVFQPEDTEHSIHIKIIADDIVESDEKFLLQLSPSEDRYVCLNQSNADGIAVITILNDDMLTFGFERTSYSPQEDAEFVALSVLKEGNHEVPTTVHVQTHSQSPQSQTAIDGADYIGVNKTLTFHPGQSIHTVFISLIDDDTTEDNEHFTALLILPEAGVQTSLSQDTVITIIDNDEVEIGLNKTVYSVSEGDGEVRIVVHSEGQLERKINVLLSTKDGSARESTDYSGHSEILEFGPGVSMAQIDIPIIADNTHEQLESFTVEIKLLNQSGIKIKSSRSMARVDVIDDDTAVGFSSREYTVTESDKSVELLVSKKGQLRREIELRYTTQPVHQAHENSALTDFGSERVVTFGEDETILQLVLPLVDDNVVEVNEVIQVKLSIAEDDSVELTADTATIIVIDDDEVMFRFDPQNITVNESEGRALLHIHKAGMAALPLTVTFSTTDFQAIESQDYISKIEVVVFQPNETQKSVAVDIVDDTIYEGPESFQVALRAVSRGITVDDTPIWVTIVDEDDFVTLRFVSSQVLVEESQGSAQIVVSKIGHNDVPVVVNIKTEDSTAKAAADYLPVTMEMVFTPEDTVKSFNITLIPDQVFESMERFDVVLLLIDDMGKSKVLDRLSVIIIDSSSGLVVTLDTAKDEVMESEREMVFTVKVIGQLEREILLHFSTDNIDASAGKDYESTSLSLTLSPDQLTVSFGVPIVNDHTVEGVETFKGLLSTSLEQVMLINSTVNVTILDDDNVCVKFDQLEYSASEEERITALQIRKEGLNDIPIHIIISTEDGSAVKHMDYIPTLGGVTFGPHDSILSFNVTLIDDDALEDKEVFHVLLRTSTAQSTYVKVESYNASVFIIDQDTINIGFSQADQLFVNETQGTLSLMILKEGDTNIDIHIEILLEDDSATGNIDYVYEGHIALLQPGDEVHYVNITIMDDGILEATEVFIAKLRVHSNQVGINLVNNTLPVNIIDNDYVILTLDSTNMIVSEEEGMLNLTIKKQGVATIAVTMVISTQAQEAQSNEDYVEISESIVIEPNQTRVVLTVPILNDGILERNESFTVQLVAGENIIIEEDYVTVWIVDDDVAQVGFEDSQYVISEQNDSAEICITASIPVDFDLDIFVVAMPVTASLGDDFILLIPQVTLGDKQSTQCIMVGISSDQITEDTEEFQLRLYLNESNLLERGRVVLSPDTATISIIDDDRIYVGFESSSYLTREGEHSVDVCAVIKTGRIKNTAVQVKAFITSETAKIDEDFIVNGSTLVFTDTDLRQCITLIITDDTIIEMNEHLTIELKHSELHDHYELLQGSTSVVIEDNDYIEIGFAQSAYSVVEGEGEIIVEVLLHPPSTPTFPISVTVDIETNDADELIDWSLEESTFILTDLSFLLSMTINSDNKVENNESFSLILHPHDPRPGFKPTGGEALITILDDDYATLSYEFSSYTVDENDGILELSITLVEGTLERNISIALSTMDMDARSFEDFALLESALTFSTGSSAGDEQKINVKIIDDQLVELDEKFWMEITSEDDAVQLAAKSAQITIIDNDVINVKFNSEPHSVMEGEEAYVCLIFETGRLKKVVHLSVVSRSDTANFGEDYSMPSMFSIILKPGDNQSCFAVDTVEDDQVEGDETFQLILTSSDQAVVISINGTLTVHIEDNDVAVFGLDAAMYTVAESNDLVIPVYLLENKLAVPVSLEVKTSAISATAEVDYLHQMFQLIFQPGSKTGSYKNISVAILSDAVVENQETFHISMTPLTTLAEIREGKNSTIGIIQDTSSVVVGFERSQYFLHEGVSHLTVCLRLEGGRLDRPVDITLTTRGGTAQANADYTDVVMTEFLPADSNLKCVDIAITDDKLVEMNESFALSLSTMESALSLNPDVATVTIIDNDKVTLALSQNHITVQESAGDLRIIVELVGDLQREVVILLESIDGTASYLHGDYAGFSEVLTFHSGSKTGSTVSYTATLEDDHAVEELEYFVIHATSLDKQVQFEPQRENTTVYIQDNDVIGVMLESISYSVEEGATVDVCVMLRGELEKEVQLSLVSQAGTAQQDEDYVAIMSILSLLPGDNNVCFSVETVEDNFVEGKEMFQIMLNGNDPAIIMNGANVVNVTIKDNDNAVFGLQTTEYTVGDDESNISIAIIVLEKELALPVELQLISLDISASNGGDYIFVPTTLRVPQGSKSGDVFYVSITILPDSVVENTESFQLILSSLNPLATIDEKMKNSIINIADKNTINIGFEQTVYTVQETMIEQEICMIIEGGALARPVDLIISSSDITATAPEDYKLINYVTSYSYSDGARKCINITIVDDDIVENMETFVVWLTSKDEAVSLISDHLTLTIIDNDKARLALQQTNFTVNESIGHLEVNVGLDGKLERNVIFSLKTRDETALAQSGDYAAISDTLTFSPDNDTSISLFINIHNDQIVERQESFSIEVVSSDSAVLLEADKGTAFVIINDDDTITVNFVSSSYSAFEGGTVEVCIVLESGQLERSVQFSLVSQSDTAQEGADYVAILLSVTWEPDTSQKCFSVRLVGDHVVEGEETFQVVLASHDPSVVVPTPGAAHITIQDNDSAVFAFEFSEYTVNENAEEIIVSVLLETELAVPVSLHLSPSDISAFNGEDYSLSTSVQVEFQQMSMPGDKVNVSIAILPDDMVESEETFKLTLSSLSPLVSALDSSTITIIDQSATTLGFDKAEYYMHENDTSLEICVTRHGGMLSRPLDLTVTSSDGSASDLKDYSKLLFTIIFSESDGDRLCINVTIIDDLLLENDENFTLLLTSIDSAVSVKLNTTTVTILDDDIVTLALRPMNLTVTETSQQVHITIVLIGSLEREVLLMLESNDGTASSISGDYYSISKRLTFPPSSAASSSLSVNITISNDLLVEEMEYFTVHAFSMDAAAHFIPGRNSTTFYIEDDDLIMIKFESTLYSVGEGATVRVCVTTESGQLERSIQFSVASIPDSAEENSDYSPVALILTLLSGENHTCFSVETLDDDVVEREEAFTIVLRSQDKAVIVSTNTIIINIHDSDCAVFGLEFPLYFIEENDESIVVSVLLLEKDLSFPISLQLMTTDLTAIAGVDYIPSSKLVTFQTGSKSGDKQSISVATPLMDNIVEDTESFQIHLTTISSMATVRSDAENATVNIADQSSVSIGFEESHYYVTENQSQIEICIVLQSGHLDRPLNLLVSTSDYSAQTPMDYTELRLMTTLNGAKKCIDVGIVDDQYVENNDSFLLTLNSSDISVSLSLPVIVTIINDDHATIGFQQSQYTIFESSGHLDLVIELTGFLEKNISLTVESQDQKASVNRGDYTAISESLVFPSGSMTGSALTLTIDIGDDNFVEEEEYFIISLRSLDVDIQVEETKKNALIFIEDDDSIYVNLESASYSVVEGEAAKLCAVIQGGDLERNVELEISVVGLSGSAQEEDYKLNMSTISLGSAQNQSCTTIEILKDSLVEGEEIFQVLLSSRDSAVIISRPNTAALSIEDDNNAVLGFELTDYFVSERDGSLTLSVVLLHSELRIPTSVLLSTEDVTATNGIDYIFMDTTLTFPSNSKPGYVRNITITILSDSIVENTEFFQLRLSYGSPHTIIDKNMGTATVGIHDQTVVTVGFEVAEYSLHEGMSSLEVCILLEGGQLDRPVNTALFSNDKTALAQVDYAGLYTTEFEPTDRKCVEVTIKDDTLVERDETFTLALSSNDSAVHIISHSATVTIIDNDQAIIGFVHNSYTTLEGIGQLEIGIQLLDGPSLEREIVVYVESSDESAVSINGDYVAFRRMLTFPQGSSPYIILPLDVAILDDNLVEGLEYFTLHMGTTDGTVIGKQNSTIFIKDDDLISLVMESSMYSVAEGEIVEVCVAVESGELESVVQFSILSYPGSAQEEDYNSVFLSTSLSPGESRVCFPIETLEDNTVEGEDTFYLILSSQNPAVNISAPNLTLITIEDNDAIEVRLESASYTVAEGGTVEVCAIVENGQFERNIQLSISSQPGSAQEEDYVVIHLEHLILQPRDERSCVTVATRDDDLVEGIEAFQMTVTSSDVAVVITTPTSTTIQITDNDHARFGFESSVYSFNEGPSIKSVAVVLLEHELTSPVSVQFTVADLSATWGTDYDYQQASVTFLSGEKTGDIHTIFVGVNRDTIVEATESFQLHLSCQNPLASIDGERSISTVYITDQTTATIGFESAQYMIREDTPQLIVCLILQEGRELARPVDFTVSSSDGTAHAPEDYISIQLTTRFVPSQGHRKCLQLRIVDDWRLEDNEVLSLSLTLADPSIFLGLDQTLVTILDNDQVMIGFQQAHYMVEESIQQMELTVELLGDIERDVSVMLESEDGTAIASDGDYIPFLEVLTFFKGSSSGSTRSVRVYIQDDPLVEGEEYFTIHLSPVDAGVQIQQSMEDANIYIISDDVISSDVTLPVEGNENGDDDERSCTKRSGCSSDTRSRTKSKKTRASHNSRSRPRSEPAEGNENGDDDERSCTKRSGCSSDTRSRTKSKKTRASHNSRSRPRSEPASRPKTEKTKKTKKKGR